MAVLCGWERSMQEWLEDQSDLVDVATLRGLKTQTFVIYCTNVQSIRTEPRLQQLLAELETLKQWNVIIIRHGGAKKKTNLRRKRNICLWVLVERSGRRV